MSSPPVKRQVLPSKAGYDPGNVAAIVNPFPWEIFDTGRTGGPQIVLAPAQTPPGYSVTLVHDRVTPTDYNMGEYLDVIDDARDVAKDIVSRLMWQKPNGVRFPIGVFVAEGKEPTELELARMKLELDAYAVYAISEGNELWIRYRKGSFITDHHRWAAGRLGQDLEWARDYKGMQQCPECKRAVSESASVCGFCRYIFDWNRAALRGLLDGPLLELGYAQGFLVRPEVGKSTVIVPEPRPGAGPLVTDIE